MGRGRAGGLHGDRVREDLVLAAHEPSDTAARDEDYRAAAGEPERELTKEAERGGGATVFIVSQAER